MTNLFYIVNIIVADVLAPCDAKSQDTSNHDIDLAKPR